MAEDLALGGGHIMQYTGDVSELYTCNLYNLINQCYPNTFNLKEKDELFVC